MKQTYSSWLKDFETARAYIEVIAQKNYTKPELRRWYGANYTGKESAVGLAEIEEKKLRTLNKEN